jgi:GNAT superfamily N-acetyltransferase
MNISTIGFGNRQDELRRIQADDLTLALTKTYSAAFAAPPWEEDHDPKELLAKWDTLIRSGQREFFECRRNNEVVGGGAFAPLQNFNDKVGLLPERCSSSMYIEELWVSPDRQGKQAGRFILVNMEQMILNAGCKQISLWTHYSSNRLTKFYSVNGYQDIGDVDPKDGGVTRKVFFKDLGEPMETGGHHHG